MWMFDEVNHPTTFYSEMGLMGFHFQIRDRAIQALEPRIRLENYSAKEIVLLAKKYRVLKWLKNGYTFILRQSIGLSASELSAVPSLDWETIGRLLSAKLRMQLNLQDLSSAIEQEFREEFLGMN